MLEFLKTKYSDCPGIDFIEKNELILVLVNNHFGTAEIALQGAQINRFKPKNKDDLLFTSEANTYSKGSPLRGGIPICWPWFGDLDKNPASLQKQLKATKTIRTTKTTGIESIRSAPAHGFVRDRDWGITAIECLPEFSRITFNYKNSKTDPLWPFEAELFYTVEVGDSLTASLTVNNNDSQIFEYSQALHSYFSIKDIQQTIITSFNKLAYTDALAGWVKKQQNGDIRFAGEVDRIYHAAPNPIELIDQVDATVISIQSSGASSTIVWNPWVEKAKSLSQFNDADFKRMVCIESANTLDGSIRLKPGEAHTLSVTLGYG